MQDLIHWLRKAREGQGLSMRDVGERLGVPHTYVQKVETGERRLDVVEYVWYCQAIGILPHDGLDLILSAFQTVN
ncbi:MULTISPECIES: helix-turn-helix domain-containing protein [Enterobacteriaceae]|uniref:helix-turn-helix domain-containing protein n=1 Tax=Enterobacteriaceae TaxID=543 RepID=UPI000669857F|nr:MULTISPECIES: helix-turn-helix transcriptional regulator [Enterobacteriaceae]MBD3695589.1 helix-turn-helix transcriptional regulator [Klebsiella pneumoniae]MCZ9381404.1 helix-turn-helix domain-containing protein [Klebsiella pneumoniae]OVH09312.1 transcriptional regulator [Klebsiella pneumoniae]OVH13135.1 transcriptional regulator [Klebsiella pneumoniae]HBY1214556.1 XRE family transcriptional regulator [Klebsiella pneumoniae]